MNGRPESCSLSPKGLGHAMGMLEPCWKNTKPEAQELLRGLEPHLSKVHCLPYFSGSKIGMAQALQSIASEGWIPLAAAMVGTVGKKPLWADLGLRPVVGTTVDIKLWPSPLKHRDVVLLLFCWKRWDHGSISESAINTWLKNVNLTFGPDCEDSPHFRRNGIDDLEAMRLLVDSGFDFLPETDLQKRPCLDMVMTVGLQLCALELTDKQLDTLAYLALTGLLPEFFHRERWVLAVRKSFLTQEIVVCPTRGQGGAGDPSVCPYCCCNSEIQEWRYIMDQG